MGVITDAANDLLRKGILAAVDSRTINGLMTKHGMRLGAGRFVAGVTLEECVETLKRLNAKGMRVNTTILGEGVADAAAAERVTLEYVDVLSRLATERIDGNVALKLTHLGLAVDQELALRNLDRLLVHAGDLGLFIRIDMEESRWTDATLDIYRRLVEAGHSNVGTVLQSYLRRSGDDLARLLSAGPTGSRDHPGGHGPNLRIVKGAYLEPPELAFPDKADVDRVYLELVERLLDAGSFVAVATHDETIIEHVITLTEERGISPAGRFEFQMIYGVRPRLQEELVARGFPLLVATPYGPDWYPYLMRRLAERPANLGFLLKSLVRG